MELTSCVPNTRGPRLLIFGNFADLPFLLGTPLPRLIIFENLAGQRPAFRKFQRFLENFKTFQNDI